MKFSTFTATACLLGVSLAVPSIHEIEKRGEDGGLSSLTIRDGILLGKKKDDKKNTKDDTKKTKDDERPSFLNDDPNVLSSSFDLLKALLGSSSRDCTCLKKSGEDLGLLPIVKKLVVGVLQTIGLRVDGVGSGGCDCPVGDKNPNTGTSGNSGSNGNNSSSGNNGNNGQDEYNDEVYYIYTFATDSSGILQYKITVDDGNRSCNYQSRTRLDPATLQKYANQCYAQK
ncbi:hypothetical protein E4U41_000980 [Claviceps citrina]|nr:hypothetical protein E4U41_000980 [Claviceps citrina]